jgi:hypothetical protein
VFSSARRGLAAGTPGPQIRPAAPPYFCAVSRAEMSRTFLPPPDGGLAAADAAVQLTSKSPLEDELQDARGKAAPHPKTEWQFKTSIEFTTGERTAEREPEQIPTAPWRRVYELEQRVRQTQRREFFDKWREGAVIALAADRRLGAKWHVVEGRMLDDWSFEGLPLRFWAKSRLRMPKRGGPECDLLFYQRQVIAKTQGGEEGHPGAKAAKQRADRMISAAKKIRGRDPDRWRLLGIKSKIDTLRDELQLGKPRPGGFGDTTVEDVLRDAGLLD